MVNGKCADMSAGRECDLTKWNSHSGRAIGTKEEISSLNNQADLFVQAKTVYSFYIKNFYKNGEADRRVETEALERSKATDIAN